MSNFTCPCEGLGVLGKEWLYVREPQCDCDSDSYDPLTGVHDVQCDTVPCPFCVLEGRIILYPTAR
jgi:hypothetical protein